MNAEPLLVVHGIANRSHEDFLAQCSWLQEQVGERYKLIDVYWGDLGGISDGLVDSLPAIFPFSEEGVDFHEHLTRARALMDGSKPAAQAIAARVTGELPAQGSIRVRADPQTDVHEAIREAVAQSTFVKDLTDPDVLNAVGDLVAAALAEQAPGGPFNVRSDTFTVRADLASSVLGAVKAVITAADAMIGKITGAVGGTLNQFVRGKLAGPIALTLGDVVGYHQNRQKIHERLFARLDVEAHGWGKEGKPVHVMAHSLGGLLVLDAALGACGRTLHIKRLVTFGSQPAFFHIMTPRYGLAPYQHAQPVALPASIARWTNLWHPLDVLAFVTATVFRLSDGGAPQDVQVQTNASTIADAGGWLHSVYWRSPELVAAWK
ncbi:MULTISPECIES: hypothetical protein [unclassified Pseudomonas]|uniref:hypothetical protein n=1 Tax=unclassified Pseudomonas TaxID=196821 RepID=UPI00244D6594|nr:MULTISPECIES: hypothetical protein [unclassified Pseudomonas]MDG9927380.1 hypothetical protein [Pseudomonas sp. GD04042]MDH0482449.1 hypothetical protein [Pseudomonas sp. GD04015]MDH0602801.1 hypothetical protein [Pseudomonas sp. GD03869]